jgi:hypothetical protein
MFLAILVVSCSGRLALPQEVAAGANAQLFKDPPAVVVTAPGKIVALIPIAANADTSVYSKSADTLYVLHDAGEKEARFLSAVNLTTQRVDREIKVGAGRAVELLMSNDGHRLFCYTAGSGRSFGERLGGMPTPREGGFDSIGELKPPFEPVISVIDTESNEVMATYEWLNGFRAAAQKARYFASEFLATSDGAHVIVCSVLDGCSRFLVHWDLRESMKEADIEMILERAKEKCPAAKPRIISDNGPQFIARDFKEFIRISGMTHVRTSPFYPQSNGKIERWHKSLKRECIRPLTPLTLDDARRLIQIYVDHYNTVRLHSAIGYVTPQDRLAGRQAEIHAARDRKLEQARSQRQLRRQQTAPLMFAHSSTPATMTSPGETEAGTAGMQPC